MKSIFVLYHNDCFDGFGGAWAAWKKFGTAATYIGLEHQEDPPKGLRGKILYFIDFTYPESIMRKIIKDAKRVIVLDHHKSNEKATKLASEYRFSLGHSGCMLAWQYFHAEKRAPRLLTWIQDHDLFTMKISHTRELISYLGTLDHDFRIWSAFAQKLEIAATRKKIIETGSTLLKARQTMIARTLPYAMPVLFEGYRTLAINSPVYYSELANGIYSKLKKPFGISWYYRDHKLHVSLRSDGTIDMSKLALKYGGGGHRGAAGFTVSLKKGFPWKFL